MSGRDQRGMCHIMWSAIIKAIAIKDVIAIGIKDQVRDRDQANIDNMTLYATIKATAIGQVYQVCATQVQDCYLL